MAWKVFEFWPSNQSQPRSEKPEIRPSSPVAKAVCGLRVQYESSY